MPKSQSVEYSYVTHNQAYAGLVDDLSVTLENEVVYEIQNLNIGDKDYMYLIQGAFDTKADADKARKIIPPLDTAIISQESADASDAISVRWQGNGKASITVVPGSS